MFKTAIFDMDGLLIDSERIIMQACMQAAEAHGIRYTREAYVELIGRAGPDSRRLMISQLGGEENHAKVVSLANSILAERGGLFPLKSGVSNLLEWLKRNEIFCGVASSSHTDEIHHRLVGVNILDYFKTVTGGNEVSRGKPNPDIYLHALEKMQAKQEETIAFEDSENGARAAIAAGLRVIVVPDLVAPSAFVKARAYHVIASLDEMINLLEDDLCALG